MKKALSIALLLLAGDMNMDGLPDVAVGAPNGSTVWVVLAPDW